jgi:lactate permease
VAVYTQDFDPVAHSLGLTAVIAALPIVTLIVLLGVLRMKAQWAVLIALVTGDRSGHGGLWHAGWVRLSSRPAEGATFGLFPIMWIVVAAVWVYNMTVESGHFAVLRRSIGSVSEDQRVQAVLIAFCFGTLLEALAGFGAPAAITATMMAALGFKPIKAAALACSGTRRPSPSARSRSRS